MTGKRHKPQDLLVYGLRVRGAVWGTLMVALLLAGTLPIVTTWRASFVALSAHAYLMPAAPRADEPAQVVIELTNPTDKIALQGPWAKAIARWDMLRMSMGTRQRAVPGVATKMDRVVIPLCLDMAGYWWAQVVLQTPGRPERHVSLQFDVQPQPAPSSPSPATALPGATVCTPVGGAGVGCV